MKDRGVPEGPCRKCKRLGRDLPPVEDPFENSILRLLFFNRLYVSLPTTLLPPFSLVCHSGFCPYGPVQVPSLSFGHSEFFLLLQLLQCFQFFERRLNNTCLQRDIYYNIYKNSNSVFETQSGSDHLLIGDSPGCPPSVRPCPFSIETFPLCFLQVSTQSRTLQTIVTSLVVKNVTKKLSGFRFSLSIILFDTKTTGRTPFTNTKSSMCHVLTSPLFHVFCSPFIPSSSPFTFDKVQKTVTSSTQSLISPL